jgi:hypothetical protein
MALLTIILCLFSLPGFTLASESAEDEVCKKIPSKQFEKTREYTAFSLQFKIDGKRYVFADLGCAASWRDKQCSSRQGAFDGSAYVFDFLTRKKIAAQPAIYISSEKISSPADFGIGAFENLAEAEEFLATNGGKKMTYDEVMALTQ